MEDDLTMYPPEKWKVRGLAGQAVRAL
jgi:hypothetical protein